VSLRPYQQSAHDAAMSWVRKCTEPCVIEAATGAGKSHIIAALVSSLHSISGGKHVLCLAPSAELVEQNREKYLLTGEPASIFSASAGGACLRHPAVFGTPLTVKNKVHRFGRQFCAVIIDECHGITPTIQAIITSMREHNPNLRVIGLSATPFRLGDGYIYAMDEKGRPTGDQSCRDPYFAARVYQIGARMLIDMGYLTPPVVGSVSADGYETLDMALNSRGQFDKADVDRAYHGHGRKTAAIVADVIAQSRARQGVMFFAATVQHAEEIMASLPPGLSAIVTGSTKQADRRRTIARFKAREIKYLVNVSVLTTGFDAAHVDVIAILRATESVGLLQQIIGRGLRLDDGKEDCLVLDYAQNIERHCPDGDLFDPTIRASFKGGDTEPMVAVCEDCQAENSFAARKNDDGFAVDNNGYFVDLDGNRVETEHGPMPAHHGRRCQALHSAPGGRLIQCAYRWTTKVCPHCDADNDIAARYCSDCKGEIIDPNEKLRIEFKAMKRDPTRLQTDNVVSWEVKPSLSRAGNRTMMISYVTEYRSFTVWLMPESNHRARVADWVQFCTATNDGKNMPQTVTYRKDKESGMYRVHGYNEAADAIS